MTRRRHPSQLGRCTRWLPMQLRTCGKSARFSIYGGTQELCKECHTRFKAGKDTQFDPGIPPTVTQLWAFQQRLANLVPG